MIFKLPVIRSYARNLLKTRHERFPGLLSIEISSHCNSSCIMCPRSQLTRKIQHMDKKLFGKILSDCRGKPLRKVNLFWFGDSFCHPDIIEYLEMARDSLPGVKLYISTNAGLLNRRKSDEILEKRLLDVINFDIDGTSKETYEKIRVGVKFNRVMENVKYFLEKKKGEGFKKPQTRATIIKMEDTLKEIDDFKKYWAAKVDCVDINDYNTWLGNISDRNVGESLERSKTGSFSYPCMHPWTEMVISADGRAGLCCLDFDLTAQLGDLNQESIEEIWKGDTITDYRNSLINLEYSNIHCCRNCNAYIYQDRSFWAKLWRK